MAIEAPARLGGVCVLRSIGMRRHVRTLALLPLLLSVSCGDDPAPEGDTWQEATLEDAPSPGFFSSIAFSGTRGLAVGASPVSRGDYESYSPYMASRTDDDTWTPIEGDYIPPASQLSAVGFTTSGDAVVAGIDYDAPYGFVIDERNGWSRSDLLFGGRAFAASSNVVRAGGAGVGNNAVLRSESPDVWVPESIPFPSSSDERALTDIDAQGGVFVACGFDDGAEGTPESPNSVVFRDSGSGWQRLDAPCGGCTNREFRAVAVTPSGSFFLGGAITDFSSGAPDQYRAFLLLATTAGDWVEIVLPNSGELDRVNDILITDGGDVYLACGMGRGVIIRQGAGTTTVVEAMLDNAEIRGLAESSDGSVWAAGSVTDEDGLTMRPAIWLSDGPTAANAANSVRDPH